MADTVSVKVLGSGCPKCHKLEEVAKEATSALGSGVKVEHVYDYKQIMAYGVMTTPALVVNEVVKSAGRIPTKDEIAGWAKEALAK
jgi:small redox-active disulfide protein 2